MHLLRAALAVLVALAFAVPSSAAPPEARTKLELPAQLFVSGLHASDVEPLVHGVVLESAHVLVYAGCYLALASEDTCRQIASNTRARLE